VRKSTALVASLVALSAVAISLRIGELSTEQAIQANFNTESQQGTDITNEVGLTPAQSEQSSQERPDTTTEASPSPAQSEQSSQQLQSTPVVPIPELKPLTVESDPISYKYGVVQLSVTMVGSEITAVGLVQGETSNGRDKAYKILEDATIQTQGTNYGNVSGATFTTDAYKLAVENALSKF
jgi:hypothetical protein